jgi:hypothetical protein
VGGLLWMVSELARWPAGSGVDKIRWEAAHPVLSGIMVSVDFVGSGLLAFSIPVWFLLARPLSPRLAWAGAVAGVFGKVAQAMIHGVEVATYLVAVDGRVDPASFDRASNGPGGIPLAVFMVMFLVGAFAGNTLSVLALWRARTLPRGSLVLWLAFLAANLLPVPVPTTVLAAAALCWMAMTIARAGSARLP